MMVRYRNSSGSSGVVAYETGNDFIKVQFHDRKVYLYSYKSAGSHHVEQMKTFAERGRGLNSYINSYVRNNYETKF
jgi:hypothetical protein